MKKILLTFIILILSISSFSNNIVLKDITGKNVNLESFKGKPLYIKAWASWCSICLSTLSHTQAVYTNKNKNYEVITIVFPNRNGEKSEESFKNWYKGLTKYNNIPVYFDTTGEFYKTYNIRAYPTNIFLDKNLKIKDIKLGPVKKEQIDTILK